MQEENQSTPPTSSATEKQQGEPTSHPSEHQEKMPDFSEDTVILAWTAPGRPWKKRTRTYYATSLLITLLVEIILFLFGQYIMMLTVIAFIFLAFALATIPPHDFHYRITHEGILVEDHFYIWEELYDFYFKKRFDQDVLFIRTRALLPGEVIMTLGTEKKDDVRNAIISFLPYREFVKSTFIEKASDWLTENFPLERA